MAAIIFTEQPWHDGEKRMQEMMNHPGLDNPSVPRLSSQAAAMLHRAPLLAIGTLDEQGRPWTSLWGGDAGFSRALPQLDNHIAVKVDVDGRYDPVVEQLLGTSSQNLGGGMREGLRGKMVSALSIDLESRKRVKLFGRAVAGALGTGEDEEGRTTAVAQLIIGVEQSLGNCPKYLNAKDITPASTAGAQLISDSAKLSDDAVKLVQGADTFFISSFQKGNLDGDTNHRGGPAGFVRVMSDERGITKLVWPEYSGNRLYQTLGNLISNPRAGIVIPQFASGDVLFLTGATDVLVGQKAADVIPHSNLAVVFAVTAARHVREGLAFRGQDLQPSPYNPTVRPLASERKGQVPTNSGSQSFPTVKLVKYSRITPTVARFRFAFAEDSPTSNVVHKPGQWAALDFSAALYHGYSHMKDDDPQLINDDFIRTFTVSSAPAAQSFEFEITVRKVGRITEYLFDRAEKGIAVEAVLRGFGGDFTVKPADAEAAMGKMAFIASGVGITPLLAEAAELLSENVVLLWTLQAPDIDLALDFVRSYPALAPSMRLFVTGNAEVDVGQLQQLSVDVKKRRLQKHDIEAVQGVRHWHLCTSPAIRKTIVGWMPQGAAINYEDFSY